MQARRARVARQRAKPDAAAFAVSRRSLLGVVADQSVTWELICVQLWESDALSLFPPLEIIQYPMENRQVG
ncbi:hypothetical protein FEAC_30340 [Ferrimicrobium acidiphilum DSM 19497]|uniref:Uncharacterized protein n=1 Tax=Ferrimicrobium acidiphilum DSM 19497 TaxID=1121877 RepID=A0A0D8FSL4_9ACTN|nr:hypothetical protein FEAC_30340 [Ferrimicrobium acidiphilum DSM 19497]